MKVSYSHHWNQSKRYKRGYKKFAALLLQELRSKHGIILVTEDQPSDIHLTMISGKQKARSKNILRIDGVYYDHGRLGMNRSIKNSVKSFDAVVFQSKWCETFATRMLQVKPKKSVVIHNGSYQNYKEAVINKYGFDKIFVWH